MGPGPVVRHDPEPLREAVHSGLLRCLMANPARPVTRRGPLPPPNDDRLLERHPHLRNFLKLLGRKVELRARATRFEPPVVNAIGGSVLCDYASRGARRSKMGPAQAGASPYAFTTRPSAARSTSCASRSSTELS
jgi:hypothetical protein